MALGEYRKHVFTRYVWDVADTKAALITTSELS